tara:strand:+ start:1287 stop:2120 length:834 start_codon:yes stop_codon:yes gene_type:complete
MSSNCKNRLLFGYLIFLNEENENRRMPFVMDSIKSLSILNKQDCDLVVFDNNSIPSVKKYFKENVKTKNFFSFCENYYDVPVLFLTAYHAKINGYDYCAYTYDDFIVYSDTFISSCIDFMDSHLDVNCLRLGAYNFSDKDFYDKAKTSLNVNPDAVRHYNDESRQSLIWEGPFEFENDIFYKTNWHYTSRPSLWRTDDLLSAFEELDNIPTLREFERFSYGHFKESLGFKVGVLDGGAMRTVKQSEIKDNPDYKANINKTVDKLKLLGDYEGLINDI